MPVTAEIVVPAILITATAIVLCIVARMERREALDQADKFGEIAVDFCGMAVKAMDKVEELEKDRDFWRDTVGDQQEKLDTLKSECDLWHDCWVNTRKIGQCPATGCPLAELKGAGVNLQSTTQQTGRQANEKKGEAQTDNPSNGSSHSTRPTDSLSGMRGPETKTNGAERILEITTEWAERATEKRGDIGRTNSDR